MKNQVSQIGVITYKNYTENVIIDNNFDTQALYDIIDNDPDFVSFHVEGEAATVTRRVLDTIKFCKEHGINGLAQFLFGDKFTKNQMTFIKSKIAA
jgi:hypothetical protein